MKECILLMILTIYAYWDICEKKLPVMGLVAGVMVSLILGWGEIRDGENMSFLTTIPAVFLRLLPGLLLSAAAVATKGKVGDGDGMIIIMIGLAEGVNKTLRICMLALGISFVYSCYLLFFRREEKEYTFPFAPFCFLGMAVMVLMES